MDKIAPPERLGRYEIIRELGKGAMGVVYEGRDPSLGRTVAIKTARRDVIERSGLAQEMMERFLREAKSAGMLNHPNIITIYDVGEEAGMAYIAMEFLVGRDLNTLIDQQKRFDVKQVVDYGVQICEALACAHDQGVYHRDVKPANIFIPDQGVLKVVDFGIARTHDSTLTQDGALIGTPTYMSPEQFMGQRVDARSDLFSAGIILYEMLTGEKPFTGEALTTIMHHILKSNPAPPHELNYMVPEALSAVVMKALSKKPQERYPDGRAMAKALRESLKDNPDMSVITGAPAAGEATVVTTASDLRQMQAASDGTVLETTAPGSLPAPASDATVPGNAPVPAVAAPSPAQVSSPVAASAPKPNLLQLAAQHGRIVLGIAAVLCIIAGVSINALLPENRPADETAAPPAVEAEQSGTPAVSENSASVSDSKGVWVYVFTTKDSQVATDFMSKKYAGDDIDGWMRTTLPPGTIIPAGKAGLSIRTSNPDKPSEIYNEKVLSGGTCKVGVPANVQKVQYDVLYNGQSLYNITITGEDVFKKQDFILEESLLN